MKIYENLNYGLGFMVMEFDHEDIQLALKEMVAEFKRLNDAAARDMEPIIPRADDDPDEYHGYPREGLD